MRGRFYESDLEARSGTVGLLAYYVVRALLDAWHFSSRDDE